MIPRVKLDWRDPASWVALLTLAIIGALLLTDRAVTIELWAILTFILGGHVSQGGSGQIITAINGGAKAALTHEPEAIVVPDRRASAPVATPVSVVVNAPPSAVSS